MCYLYGIKQTVNMVAIISCVTYMVLSRQLTWLLLYHVLLIFTLYEDFKLVFIDIYLLCNYYVNRLFIHDMTSSTSV